MQNTGHNLLPVRFAPEPEELFSSWLMRLAMAHALKLHTFSRILFPERELWKRDIDKSADEEHIMLICARTGHSPARIFASTLRSFESRLYESHNPNGNTSWILPAGVHCLTRKGFGLQICPQCLAEDKEPHFRRGWRLSWTTICTTHKTVLLDRCPGCRNPILFHRGDMGWRNQTVSISMVQCPACSLLWTSKKVLDSLSRADPGMIEFQRKLESALTENWCGIPGFGMVHTINFFKGLKHLLGVLSFSRRGRKFREGVSSKFGLPVADIKHSESHTRSFDYLPLESRYRTLRLAEKLLAGWPNTFVDVALATGTYSSVFLSYEDNLPFWYWQPVHEHLTRKTHPVSEDEIWSALAFLEKRRSFILPMDLESLLGRNFFEYKSDKLAVSIYGRMKKFNDNREKERLANIRLEAKQIADDRKTHSKTRAKNLSQVYRRYNSKPTKTFKKTQKMFDSLIIKYKRRERLRMAKRMEQKQNAAFVAGEFGVSPGIVTKWHNRYKKDGIAGLDDRSRRANNFRQKLVFEKQEGWIRLLHAEGLELSEIKIELKRRYNFELTEGGLYRVLNRLRLILPCSSKDRFVKRNRKKSYEKRVSLQCFTPVD